MNSRVSFLCWKENAHRRKSKMPELLNFPNGDEGLLRESAEDFRKTPITWLFVELSQTVQRGSKQPTEKEWRKLDRAFQEKAPEYRTFLKERLPNRRQYRVAQLMLLGLRSKNIMPLMGINSFQQVSNIKRIIRLRLLSE